MAHMLEFTKGVANMAYAGEVPWHGLGKKVPNDLTPIQMLEAAGLDWRVEKVPAYAIVEGRQVDVNRSALVRKSDNKILDIVSNDWNEVQNFDAAEFFNDFVGAGDMEMHTAGSLKDGQIIWFLAKVKESFDLFKGDQVDSYLLFTNFHRYGCSTDVRFTPIRVVCNNTLTLSLNSTVERMVKFSHRREFKPDVAKQMLGIASDKLAKYKEMAEFLGSKKAKDEDIVTYFKRVFPLTTAKAAAAANDDPTLISRNADTALQIMSTQPGSKFAEGTWWQPFNAVTYMTDHLIGRSTDSRLTSAWYGHNRSVKTNALELALEMAAA